MPTYEYICTECREKIEIFAPVSEKEKGLQVLCPKCGSNKTAQVFGNFMVMGSKTGVNMPPTCDPQSGPGCCGG